jgi:hypothetical protein
MLMPPCRHTPPFQRRHAPRYCRHAAMPLLATLLAIRHADATLPRHAATLR